MKCLYNIYCIHKLLSEYTEYTKILLSICISGIRLYKSVLTTYIANTLEYTYVFNIQRINEVYSYSRIHLNTPEYTPNTPPTLNKWS